ncbi:hypothetical protein, partial [Leifsonia sp. SIMBA_070]|uniref:hypothetical protein n=1 Tax=Leifsonia sp. SIMBA_070 TaxID=3085810 RepID=UPI00397A1C31
MKIVLHVIADQATVDGRAENPGFMDGHSVISGDHVRDIAERPETVQRPMGNKTEPAPTEEETPKPKRPRIYMRG